MNYFYIFAFLASFSSMSLLASEPKTLIEGIFKKASLESFKTDAKAQSEVSSHFDYMVMTKKILGSEASKHSADEIGKIKNLIQQIIELTVYPEAYDFLKSVKMKFEVIKSDTKSALLQTSVRKRGEETEVISRFEKMGSDWKITDIIIDDESWVENIKEQVSKTIKKKQWNGLVNSLQNRLNDLKSGKKVKSKLDEN